MGNSLNRSSHRVDVAQERFDISTPKGARSHFNSGVFHVLDGNIQTSGDRWNPDHLRSMGAF